MFSIGSVSFLAVMSFAGFDRPQTATLVTLIGDGVSTRDQVLQQGATPFLQATVSGVLTESADVAALRGYYASKETVSFTDGNGNTTDVRVLEFSATDLTDWWEFDMTLLESDDATVTQAGTTLAASSAVGTTNLKVASVAGLVAGDNIRVGYLGKYEIRTLTTVGTSGSGGTGISFTGGLVYAHSSGERVVEVSGT
jgi:hypothetical protein